MILWWFSTYKCPKCGNLLIKGNLISGNTIGATFYTDGKMYAPMLEQYPNISKCHKCNTILWLRTPNLIDSLKWGSSENIDCQEADYAKFLNIEDNFRALSEWLVENKNDEIYIRQHIWWGYNDRVRKGESQFIDSKDEIKWRENCIKLISILDQSVIYQKLMIAELKRNLGDFEGCLEIVENLKNEDRQSWIDTLIAECKKWNTSVVMLNV